MESKRFIYLWNDEQGTHVKTRLDSIAGYDLTFEKSMCYKDSIYVDVNWVETRMSAARLGILSMDSMYYRIKRVWDILAGLANKVPDVPTSLALATLVTEFKSAELNVMKVHLFYDGRITEEQITTLYPPVSNMQSMIQTQLDYLFAEYKERMRKNVRR